jgi:hypothetical protein
VAVAEQVRPPGTDGVEEAMAIHVLQPRALRAADRHQRQGLVQLHLGARVPDGVEAAAEEVVVVHGWICGQAQFYGRRARLMQNRNNIAPKLG